MKSRLVLLLFLIAGQLFAQQNFTLKQATFGKWRDFAPETYDFVQWRPGHTQFTHLKEYSYLMLADVKDGWKDQELVDLLTLAQSVISLSDSLGFNLQVASFPYFPYDYTWVNENEIVFDIQEGDYIYHTTYNPTTKKSEILLNYTSDAGNVSYGPNNKSVAYTIENDLYLRTGLNGLAVPVAVDEDPGIVNGDGYVHRQEFGIHEGIFWSPQGNYLAYYRKDETMVADYPLVNSASRVANAKMIKYPMAGEVSEEVTLVIYDINKNKNLVLKVEGPADQYLTSITWDPSEKYIYVGVLNRGQDHLQLNKYDAQSGDYVSTLFEEKHPKYVEPLHPLTFLKTKPDQFIYQSERDGYNHLYLYNTKGKLLKQLTKGEWVVTEFVGLDNKEQDVFFIANKGEILDRHLFSVSLKSGQMKRITNTPGTHSGVLSPDGSHWVDYCSSTDIVNTVEMIQTNNGKKAPLVTALDPFGGYNMPGLEMVTLTAADGRTPLYGRIITPPNMDKSKKYPVMVYVYGGPHAQLVTNEWLGGAGLFDYYMAQQGFVVFTVDNRGSDGRGMDFENVVHRQLGQNEMADQVKGIEYLKTLPYVDQDRIGVFGWSFGGFMTISLMLNHPDIFKVGVSGGPVCDWKYYEVMYGERYMDTPQDNPEGYDKTSVINKAEQLEGKLLVIHGVQDDVVVQQHSLEFIKACIKAGKPVDYFVYPDHKHNVRGNDRVHLYGKVAQYFKDYL